MIVRDKGLWADAVDALTPWSMSGTPALIVTDCGSAFVDFDTRVGATDLGIDIDHGPAGMPEFRARIERMFGTMSTNLIGRFSGYTFSNTVVKGDYDAEARAALTTEDLSEALVRWVVDVYHRRRHRGLGGETPLNCWNRLVAKYGVAPMPSVELRRKALGTRLKRTVSKKGIIVMGIRYHSEVLARWFMHATSKEVRVRFYSEDIGAIAVELNDHWIEVPSVFDCYRGERAQTWLLAAREIRASVAAQAKVDEMVIFKAMTRIREINANALARQGLLVDDYSQERIAKIENEMLIGFDVDETPHATQMPPAALIGGDAGMARALRLISTLREATRLDRTARRKLVDLHRLLSLDPVMDGFEPDLTSWVLLDPASAEVEQICLLTDQLHALLVEIGERDEQQDALALEPWSQTAA